MDSLLWRVDPSRLASLAVTAAIVGLVAGLGAATFASVAGEPSIDDAIAIEDAAAQIEDAAAHRHTGSQTAHHGDEASVSRSDQRGIGLFGAYALTGVAFGALLALTAHGLRRGRDAAAGRFVVAGAILAGAFTVAPWLKYPPNPPAVGDPATLAERQALYVAVIGAAAIVGVTAALLSRRLRSAGWPDHRRLAVVGAAVVVPMLVVFAVLPAAPDPVAVPATLVWRFRVASLGANLTLWGLLTLGVGWVVAESVGSRERRAPAGVASPSAG